MRVQVETNTATFSRTNSSREAEIGFKNEEETVMTQRLFVGKETYLGCKHPAWMEHGVVRT